MSWKYICVFVLFVSINMSAQSSEFDSLKNITLSNKADTNVCQALIHLGVFYWDTNPDSSIYYCDQAYTLASKLKNKLLMATALKTKGVAWDIQGNLDSCLKYLNESKIGFQQIGRDDKLSHTLSDMASAWLNRGNYELALRNHFQSLKLRQKFGDENFIAISYNNIGLVYRSKKEYSKAIDFYKKSLEIKERLHNQQGVLNTYINIGSAYHSKAQYDSALYYGKLALELAHTLNQQNDMLSSQSNIAAALVNLKQTNEALPILLHIHNELGENFADKSIYFTNYESLGDLYVLKNNIPLAIDYYNKGLQLALAKSRTEAKELFYRKLAKCYFRTRQFAQAYMYLDSAKVTGDSIFSFENNRQANELSAVYQSAEMEKRITELDTERNYQNTLKKYFIIASSIFLLLSILIYFSLVANKRKKELLLEKNNEIEKSLEEKEFLMKEIHHRVKNNLQIVSSLLSLQSNYITDNQALEAVKDSQNRVHSMSLIHQSLYSEENLSSINVRDYITQLILNLCNSYNTEERNIRITYDISPFMIDVDTIVPIGLIINEVITNAIKHAFVGKKNGQIKLTIHEENNGLKISVYDNGIGVQENAQNKNSFGLKLIQAFLKKLNGTMKIWNEDGTKLELTLKYKK